MVLILTAAIAWLVVLWILNLARGRGNSLNLLTCAVVALDYDGGRCQLFLQVDAWGEDDASARNLSVIITVNFKGCKTFSYSLKPVHYSLLCPLSYAVLSCALRKIYSITMPEFLDAYVFSYI